MNDEATTRHPHARLPSLLAATLVLTCVVVAFCDAFVANVGAQTRVVRVYVRPIQSEGVLLTQNGIVPAPSEERVQSRRHLIAALAADHGLAIAQSDAQADVVVDSIHRGATVGQTLRLGPGPNPKVIGPGPDQHALAVRVTIRAGTEVQEFTGRHVLPRDNGSADWRTGTPRQWQAAADDAGRQIKHWIGENRARLLR